VNGDGDEEWGGSMTGVMGVEGDLMAVVLSFAEDDGATTEEGWDEEGLTEGGIEDGRRVDEEDKGVEWVVSIVVFIV
jgi:hypothetical protein